ncbi:unnamed protein product [Chrysoparadoxa australica]
MELLVSSALDDASPLPSFFELLMTYQISRSLQPAARHVCRALAERAPILFTAARHFDEVFLLLSWAIESRFLSRHDCLLAESFYGLRRSRISGAVIGREGNHTSGSLAERMKRLTSRDRRKALLVAVLLPYLKGKLDAMHARGEERAEEGREGHSLTRLRKVFQACYPFLHATYEGSFFAYQWMYLFNLSVCFSPDLHLTKQVVRRSTPSDFLATEVASSARGGLEDRALRYGKVALVAAVVLFKVMQWWTSIEDQAGSRGRTGEVPPPPLAPSAVAPDGGGACIRPPEDPSMCSLCRRVRVNPTVCMVSGFVFCYTCAVNYVRTHGKCPITQRPCQDSQLQRLWS